MGAVIIGKEYRMATCIKCRYEWKTSEMTVSGISEECAKIFCDNGFQCKVGDDICLGCEIDLFDKMGPKEPELSDAGKVLDKICDRVIGKRKGYN